MVLLSGRGLGVWAFRNNNHMRKTFPRIAFLKWLLFLAKPPEPGNSHTYTIQTRGHTRPTWTLPYPVRVRKPEPVRFLRGKPAPLNSFTSQTLDKWFSMVCRGILILQHHQVAFSPFAPNWTNERPSAPWLAPTSTSVNLRRYFP